MQAEIKYKGDYKMTLPQARKIISQRIKVLEQQRYDIVQSKGRVPEEAMNELNKLYHTLSEMDFNLIFKIAKELL